MFRADIPLLVKIQAFLHLTHYMVHPMMLLVVLTSIPMLYSQRFFDHLAFPIMIFTLLCLATFGPSSMYLFSQRVLYPDWKKRIKYLPFLMCLGTGIAVNNTYAVLEALLNIESGFIRTPKYGIKKTGGALAGYEVFHAPDCGVCAGIFSGCLFINRIIDVSVF